MNFGISRAQKRIESSVMRSHRGRASAASSWCTLGVERELDQRAAQRRERAPPAARREDQPRQREQRRERVRDGDLAERNAVGEIDIVLLRHTDTPVSPIELAQIG